VETVGLEPTHPLPGPRFSRPLPLVPSRLRSPFRWCRRRASNPRSRCFKPVLYRLSYRGVLVLRWLAESTGIEPVQRFHTGFGLASRPLTDRAALHG
jgi:hypothetical protein